MFSMLASLFQDKRQIFRLHPVQLSRWLDEVWAAARRAHVPGTGKAFVEILSDDFLDALDLPTQPGHLGRHESFLAPSGLDPGGQHEWSGTPGPAAFDCPPRLWHHLIYAYLIESTGIVEVFAEVIRRLVVGDTLGTLKADSVSWLRATEQLFFRDPPPFSIAGVVSDVRPYARTNRRNAYWRMFGMDLAHPIPPQWAGSGSLADWKAHAGTVGSDFREKWPELLRQVWLGVENRANTTGANPADSGYISLLCRAIKDGFVNRRRGGAFAREEFAYVSMLSWFHLTVLLPDSPIVADLQALSSNPADSLAAIAQRVGMTPAARSRELFELAEPTSTVLRGIEMGLFDDPESATSLYASGSVVAKDMVSVINNWQSATGLRLKERPTGTTTPTAQPLRVPAPTGPASSASPTTPAPGTSVVAASNGQRA